jgi:hypothetical protein
MHRAMQILVWTLDEKGFPVPASENFLNHHGADKSDWDD